MKPPGSSQQEEEAAVASPGSQSSVIYRQLSSETRPPERHPQGPPHPTLLPRGASLQQVCGYSQLPQPRPSFSLLSIKLLTVRLPFPSPGGRDGTQSLTHFASPVPLHSVQPLPPGFPVFLLWACVLAVLFCATFTLTSFCSVCQLPSALSRDPFLSCYYLGELALPCSASV